MPIANSFVRNVSEDTYRYRLTTSFCEKCCLFQIDNNPEVEMMFHGNYPFFTSSSRAMVKHFVDMFTEQESQLNSSQDFILEIGSNDGSLLEIVKTRGYRHLGVDPSSNVVERARAKGVNSLVAFFGEETAHNIVAEYGKANRIFAANVVCHIPNLHDFAKGIREILSEDGLFIFEEPYVGSMLKKCSFDQIYDEHIYIFGGLSIRNVFAQYDLELIDMTPQSTHGGSMRYTIAHRQSKNISQNVIDIISEEISLQFDKVEPYLSFQKECETKNKELNELLIGLKNNGMQIAGYGATSKSTTVLNYCGLGSNVISYICDTTPEKQGRVTPGSHIPIISREDAEDRLPDYFLLFAWNHATEIIQNEGSRLGNSVNWISFVPRVEILS